MIIHPARIYSIKSQETSGSLIHPFDLLSLGDSFLGKEVYLKEIDCYNYLFAEKLLAHQNEIAPLLDYHFYHKGCDPHLFIYNLQYGTLQVPAAPLEPQSWSVKKLVGTPVERAILAWIEEKERIFAHLDASRLSPNRSITLAQRALVFHYLQRSGLFPQVASVSRLSRLINFIVGQNLKNLYDILRKVENYKTLNNLQVVRALFKKLGLSLPLSLVEEDMGKINRGKGVNKP